MELYKNHWSEDSSFTIAGINYQKGVGFHLEYPSADSNPAVSIDYNTARKYKKFKAFIGIDDAFKDSSRQYVVKIYGDKDKVFESAEFRGGDFALPIELDISEVIRLTIEIKRLDTEDSFNEENETKIVIANAQFIQ